MREILTIEEIELIQLAMECLYSELPEYDSVSAKLVAMRKAAPEMEQEPYAYEYGVSNGDGTFSVVIDKGKLTQLGENEYGYCHPGIFASKEWPVTPLYLHPQPALNVAVLVEALDVVKAVLESDDPAIADTVWVPGAPETLLDHVCAALAAHRQQGGGV